MYTQQQLSCMVLCNSCLNSSHRHSHSFSFLLQRRGLRHGKKQSSHRQEAEGLDSRLLVFSVCASEHCAFPSLSHFSYTSPVEGTFAQGAQTEKIGSLMIIRQPNSISQHLTAKFPLHLWMDGKPQFCFLDSKGQCRRQKGIGLLHCYSYSHGCSVSVQGW